MIISCKRIDLFCIASGPSLTVHDCELVRQSGIKTIAINNSWEIAPFCDYIYAGDRKWWDIYHDKITVNAELWTCATSAANTYHINYHITTGSYNSGMRAIQFGIWKGFKSIALLGYDCSLKNGIHWHGPHKGKTLRNPTNEKLKSWDDQFKKVYEQSIKLNVNIVNCSRYTELKYFNRVPLEKVLQQ